MTLIEELGDVAAGRFDAADLTPEARLDLIESMCNRELTRLHLRRERRAAHTRGFLISAALVGQGLTDIHMWARV